MKARGFDGIELPKARERCRDEGLNAYSATYFPGRIEENPDYVAKLNAAAEREVAEMRKRASA